MDDLPVMTISSATEQAELRTVLIEMANGLTLNEACRKVGITTVTARKRMAQYPDVLSDFKRANDALMRSQLLNIMQARDRATNKLVNLVDLTEDPETLMRISDHLGEESERIQAALNTDGSSRDDEVKRIMGIKSKSVESRMEITINLHGESTISESPPIVIDATNK